MRKMLLRRKKRSSGQALIETAILIPFVLAIIFNAVNFGYFYYVALNMSAATRSGSLYAILGSNTPVNTAAAFSGGNGYAPAGPPGSVPSACATTANCTVSYLVYQDMQGSLPSGNNATVNVCSQSIGTTVSGGQVVANCKSYSSAGSSTGTNTGQARVDPENTTTGFILHQVDITYTFKPLIPSTAFGAVLLAFPPCTSSGGNITCTLRRRIQMRSM